MNSQLLSWVLVSGALFSAALPVGVIPVSAQPTFGNQKPPPSMEQKVMMPYQLSVTPADRAVDSDLFRLKPVLIPVKGLTQKACALSIRSASGGAVVWQQPADTTCSREHAVRLPIGQYRIKLAVLWGLSGSTTTYNQVQEVPYEVRAGDRLKVIGLTLHENLATTNRMAKVFVEVHNIGPIPVRSFTIRAFFQSANGMQTLRESRFGQLNPGQNLREGIGFLPVRGGSATVRVEVDKENVAGEPQEFVTNNFRELSFNIEFGEVVKPVLVPGNISTHITRTGKHMWVADYTICNVDPDAVYNIIHGCPTCRGVTRLLPIGNGPHDCRPAQEPGRPICLPSGGVFVADGTGMQPPCPANLPLRGALKPPGGIDGEISPFATHDYSYEILAARTVQNNFLVGSNSNEIIVHVPQTCRLPTCTPTETYRDEPPSIRQ